MNYAPFGTVEGNQGLSTDRRASQRYRTDLHPGKILNRNQACLCDCRIHDMSTGGARVVLSQNVMLPKLVFLYDAPTQQRSAAAIVWRKGTTLGLQFVPGKSP